MTFDRKFVKASAPGKIIITGEHFVVHGSFAVAAAIDKRAAVTVESTEKLGTRITSEGREYAFSERNPSFQGINAIVKKVYSEFGKPRSGINIKIDSNIPRGSGLGSSAAVSTVTAATLCRFLGSKTDNQTIFRFAMEGERALHGNPSGVDVEASLNGGIFLFNRKDGAKQIPLNRVIRFIVTDSGIKRDTSDLISKVADRKKEFPKIFEKLGESASFVALQVVESLTEGDLPYLGALMCLMQASLTWIGVSTPKLESLLENALTEEVFGAKLTGAGGGGSIIILPKPEKAEIVLSRMKLLGKSYLTTVPQGGLRWEEQNA